MSDMKLFQNPEFGRIRCFIIEDTPWFLAKDVCDCLGLTNPSEMLKHMDDDEKGIINSDTLGGKQNMLIINEPGIYQLAFVSRRPEAKKFKRWISHTVLPSIRKNGVYATPEAVATLSDKEIMARAVLAAQETIRQIEAERDAERILAKKMKDERDEAVRTKSFISSTREASIMGRLGNEVKRNKALTKENAELKDKLGVADSMSIKNIPWVFKYMQKTPYRGKLKVDVYNRLGSAMSCLCKEKGIQIGDKVRDEKGNDVNAYPIEAVNLMEQYILSKDEGNYYYRMMSDYMKTEYRA